MDMQSDGSFSRSVKGKGRFTVARSFIATRSGLLRWHDHEDNKDIDDEP